MIKPMEKSRYLKRLGAFAIVLSLLYAINETRAEGLYGVGEYYLGQDIKTARGLVEAAPEEHGMLQSFPGWSDVPGERIFSAPDLAFNHNRWRLFIGAVDGKISFMALQYTSKGGGLTESGRLLGETLRFVKSRLGEPAEQTGMPEQYIWDSPGENVILAKREAIGFWAVNFVLTGKSAPAVPPEVPPAVPQEVPPAVPNPPGGAQ